MPAKPLKGPVFLNHNDDSGEDLDASQTFHLTPVFLGSVSDRCVPPE